MLNYDERSAPYCKTKLGFNISIIRNGLIEEVAAGIGFL